jgi:uncharacterized protein YegJ (DUF2314 family)
MAHLDGFKCITTRRAKVTINVKLLQKTLECHYVKRAVVSDINFAKASFVGVLNK